MAPVGSTTPSALHLIVLCCAPLLRAQLVHVVTPLNAATTTTTTPNTPTTTPDTFLTAFHHAQKLRSAPADRNDHDAPDTYDTLTRSSHLPSHYPPITHEFVSPPPAPYPPYPSSTPPNYPPAPYPPNAPPTHLYPSHASPSPHYPPNDPQTPLYPSHPPAPSPYWPPNHSSHHSPHHPLHHPDPHSAPHPAPHPCPPVPYSAPTSPLLSLLPAKLSLKLLLKILLKLVLFKMIVKLIAVICLLLFIPALKSKASPAESDAEDRRARHLASMTELIWDSLDEKKWMYGDDEDMKDMRDIAEQDEDEEENALSSPSRAVNFLRFCVSAVDRVVGYILGVLQKQRNERREDLASFVLEELGEFFKNM